MVWVGAWVLSAFSELEPIIVYTLFNNNFEVLPVKLIISFLIIFFTLFEFFPTLRQIQFSDRYLSLGGVLSGFFGGLSGHQGALRTVFLARASLTKEQFVATGNAIALIIDISRISIYYRHFRVDHVYANLLLLGIVSFSAFAGAYMGNRLLKKITIQKIQLFVAISLL